MVRKGGGGQTSSEDADEEDTQINLKTGQSAPEEADRAAYDPEKALMYEGIVPFI